MNVKARSIEFGIAERVKRSSLRGAMKNAEWRSFKADVKQV